MVLASSLRRGRGGFTLIELLVTVVLLASVSAGVATVMSVCLGAWKAAQERANLAQQSEAVLDTVGRDLRASFMGRRGFFIGRDEGDGRCYLELTTASRRLMRLLYLVERGEVPGENLSDLAQVVYFGEPAADGATFALYRQEICPPQSEPLDGQALDVDNAQLLCDKVISFSLRFWDAQSADWVTEWELMPASAGTGTQTSLPVAVEIELTLMQGERQRTSVACLPLSMSEGAGQ